MMLFLNKDFVILSSYVEFSFKDDLNAFGKCGYVIIDLKSVFLVF